MIAEIMEGSTNTVYPAESWGTRALDFARSIADALPGRGSATKAERDAAASVLQTLAALKVTDVRTQQFQGLRTIWLFLSEAFGLALVGHAAYWLLDRPLGMLTALLISLAAFGLSFAILWIKLTFRQLVLRYQRLMSRRVPQGLSQNVLAVLPPSGEVRQRVVVLAHLDSHRAVWIYAHPLLAQAYAYVVPLLLWGTLAAPLLYGLAVVTGQPVLGWLGLVFALLHFLGWFTGVTADLGQNSPGANDNASAVGSALALVERLQQEPMAHTEVWLAFTGCEESGGDGMLTLLAEYGEGLKDALFLDLEMVGVGERLVYLEQEGLLRPRRISPAMRTLVQTAAQRLAQRTGTPASLQPVNAARYGAFTEMNIAWEHGFEGVCLMVFSSTERGLPQWHRLTDTAKNYQVEAFQMVHDFAWEIMRIKDEG